MPPDPTAPGNVASGVTSAFADAIEGRLDAARAALDPIVIAAASAGEDGGEPVSGPLAILRRLAAAMDRAGTGTSPDTIPGALSL
jgi:hypothetical protein